MKVEIKIKPQARDKQSREVRLWLWQTNCQTTQMLLVLIHHCPVFIHLVKHTQKKNGKNNTPQMISEKGN